MPLEPHSGNEGVATREVLFDEEAWQRVQSRLSELIGVNVHFIPPTEIFKHISTSQNPSCSDLVYSVDRNKVVEHHCLEEVFENGMLQAETLLTCVHRLHYAAALIRNKAHLIGTILIGPLLLSKREPVEVYGKMCEELGIEKEYFLDRVRELRVFSFKGIYSVLDCVQEIVRYTCRMDAHPQMAK